LSAEERGGSEPEDGWLKDYKGPERHDVYGFRKDIAQTRRARERPRDTAILDCGTEGVLEVLEGDILWPRWV